MNSTILNKLNACKAKVIVFDIDGTLKDLSREHTVALQITLNSNNVGNIRRRLILLLNVIAMFLVKTGVFPTNQASQKLLVLVYALLAGKNLKAFRKEYFENYSQQIYLFDGVHQLLITLNKEKTVYFSTINEQNYNLEECGIPQERIMYKVGIFKVTTYKKLLNDLGVEKDQVLIVGDNLFDDWFSAKLLGVQCLLVNNYNSKLKEVVCKIVNGKQLKQI